MLTKNGQGQPSRQSVKRGKDLLLRQEAVISPLCLHLATARHSNYPQSLGPLYLHLTCPSSSHHIAWVTGLLAVSHLHLTVWFWSIWLNPPGTCPAKADRNEAQRKSNIGEATVRMEALQPALGQTPLPPLLAVCHQANCYTSLGLSFCIHKMGTIPSKYNWVRTILKQPCVWHI